MVLVHIGFSFENRASSILNKNSNLSLMRDKCKTCGAELPSPKITHCSIKCLFANLWNSKSLSGIPIEKWPDDEEPWV